MIPRLFNSDIQTWANRLANYLDTIRDKLSFKLKDSNASEDGVMLWDNEFGYPVVSKDGEWRQIVLSDGKFSAISTGNIIAASANTGYTIDYDQVYISDGIAINNGVITFQRAGVYLISFTAQISSNSSSTKNFYFWPRLNGVDAPGSTMAVSLHSNNAVSVVSRAVLFTLNENDTIEAMWGVNDVDGWLNATSGTFSPVSPSSTISITRICR